jgi:bifunctional enzyme CysN/CysC
MPPVGTSTPEEIREGARSPMAAYGAVRRPTLRVLTCGSVDDGKSTLIGRLLYEQHLVFDDHLAALAGDSKRHGTAEGGIDFALLLDGLEAEREQGITIDVAYRYFSTARRSFIVADTPGHEQYTRNMATGASNAELAIILVDARKGLLPQTYRHATIVALMGIRHVLLAVNKMDLVGFDQAVFDRIGADFEAYGRERGLTQIAAIPISARHGDNVSAASDAMRWYRGRPLLTHLEEAEVERDRSAKPFRMVVQWVNRPHLDFRGYAGTIASGTVRPGDEIVIAASGQSSRVDRIVTADGDLAVAQAGDSVTLTLKDERDIARGDLLAPPGARPQLADQFATHLIWMAEEHLLPGRSYLMMINGRSVAAAVTEIKHRLDVGSAAKLAAKTLNLNEIGLCNLATTTPVAFDPYEDDRETGAFILVDRLTNDTVAAGMIAFGLRRASNVHWQGLTVSNEARSRLKQHAPAILWFTGLSGAGKSTIANRVEARLNARGVHTALLDGDNVRHGLSRDLGFTDIDRVENIRRVGEVAKLMTDAGLIVLCSFISPFRAERQMVRDLVEAGRFLEIFVDAPVAACIARDPKGLYRRALAGEIKNFTGVDQPYEPPEAPDLHLRTEAHDADALADVVVAALVERGLISR